MGLATRNPNKFEVTEKLGRTFLCRPWPYYALAMTVNFTVDQLTPPQAHFPHLIAYIYRMSLGTTKKAIRQSLFFSTWGTIWQFAAVLSPGS